MFGRARFVDRESGCVRFSSTARSLPSARLGMTELPLLIEALHYLLAFGEERLGHIGLECFEKLLLALELFLPFVRA